jgi:hypothetical protein
MTRRCEREQMVLKCNGTISSSIGENIRDHWYKDVEIKRLLSPVKYSTVVWWKQLLAANSHAWLSLVKRIIWHRWLFHPKFASIIRLPFTRILLILLDSSPWKKNSRRNTKKKCRSVWVTHDQGEILRLGWKEPKCIPYRWEIEKRIRSFRTNISHRSMTRRSSSIDPALSTSIRKRDVLVKYISSYLTRRNEMQRGIPVSPINIRVE